MARYNTAPQTLEVTGTETFSYAFTGGLISLTGTSGYTVTMVSPVFFPGSRQTFYNATDGMITIETAAGQITGNGVTLGTSVDIPTNSTYQLTSDGTDYVLTSALAGTTVFELPLTTRDLLNADGPVELNPADENVQIKPTGTGTVDISPQSSVSIQPGGQATIRPAGNLALSSSTGTVSIGDAGETTSFPGNISFTQDAQTVTISPTGAASAVTIDPTGPVIIGSGNTVTISSDSAGSMDGINIGAGTPGTGRFTTMSASGNTTFSSATASSGTGSGAVVITGGLGVGGTIHAAGLVAPISGAAGSFTTLAASDSVTFTKNAASTNTTSGTLVVTGGIGASGAIYAGSFQGTIGNVSSNSGTFTSINASGVVDITGTGEATNNSGDTGQLRCEGGASIAKRIYSGGGFQGAVGNVTRSSGAFTTLTANNTVTLSPSNSNVTLSPTGTGTVTVSPAGSLTLNPGSGTINSMSIGASSASSGKFTSLEATGDITMSRYLRHAGDTNTYLDFEGDEISVIVGGSQEITVNGTGVRLGDTGNGYFRPVSGNYGSIEIDGGAHGGWEGYSIGGRVLFMHDNSNTCGIYNDSNNEWMTIWRLNAETELHYNGGEKAATTSDGFTCSGTLRSTGNIISNTSDARLKTNIENIPNALDKVMSLNGVIYNWNEDAPEDFDKETKEVGLIAQEVEAVLPQIVHGAPFDRNYDGTTISGEDYKTLQYERVVPLLVEAIKELKEEINKLKGEE